VLATAITKVFARLLNANQAAKSIFTLTPAVNYPVQS